MKQKFKATIWKTSQQKTPTQSNKIKKKTKYEDSLRDLCDNIKHNNICFIGVQEGEERARNSKPI